MSEDSKSINFKNLIIGTVIALLALIGAVTIITGVVKLIASSSEKPKEKEIYKEFIAPVIMNDPDPFDDVINADQSQLLSISIWSLLKSDIDPDSFESTKNGMIVPASMVEEEFTKLFGKDIVPLHQTVEGGEGIQFEYSQSDNSYIIPITGINAIYSPSIVDINEKGSSTILTVGYLASEDWSQDSNGDMIAPEPVKYMKFYLRKNGEEYYISSIKQTDALETVTTQKSENTADSTEESSAADISETAKAS